MLRLLQIQNLALVDQLSWEPVEGLNAVTGETGAGKSVLLGALTLLLGGRADKTLVRTGAEQAVAEAEIVLKSAPLRTRIASVLEELGANPCEGDVLLLRRTVSAQGAGRQWINGSPATVQGLKLLGELLIDLHGPHDHQSLLSTDTQRAMVDGYGKLDPVVQDLAKLHDEAARLASLRAALELSEREREQKLDLLGHQVREISAAGLQSDEETTLERDYRLATNARQLLELAQTMEQQLTDGDGAVLDRLAEVERALVSWQRVDPGIAETAALNQQAIALLKELSSSVGALAESIEWDSGRAQALEDRMNLVLSLKRKYGPELADVIAFGQRAAADLAALESADQTRATLEADEQKARKKLERLANELSAQRTAAATALAREVEVQLRDLGFAKARFAASVEKLPTPTRHGQDAVEFIFAPNVGEAPRPLRAIASSGEMARVMLALKTALASLDAVPILVFDEIDANVGGTTAVAVGQKLRALATAHQVFCITHLAPVAAHGHAQFMVEKEVEGGRSFTRLHLLDDDARVEELARMLGGAGEKAAGLARQLLSDARQQDAARAPKSATRPKAAAPRAARSPR